VAGTPNEDTEKPSFAGVRVLYNAAFYVMVGGLYVGFFWHPAAFIALAGLIGQLVMHHVIGIVSYRSSMRRPWPHVAPLTNDDEDDW
jgi:hypothetical protein